MKRLATSSKAVGSFEFSSSFSKNLGRSNVVSESGFYPKSSSRVEQAADLIFLFDSCHEKVTAYVDEILSSAPQSLEPLIWSHLSTALRELILNAIEHGNYQLSYRDKQAALENGAWTQRLQERSVQAPFCNRRVHVHVTWTAHEFSASIHDEGFGFDWQALPDPTAVENLLSENGRGVTLARFCVDDLLYNDVGNEVTILKHLRRASVPSAMKGSSYTLVPR